LTKKVTYIISDINRAIAFEWIAQFLDREKVTLSFILINPGNDTLERFIKAQHLEVCSVKSATKLDWVKAYWFVRQQLKRIKPDVVHCHLQQASILGLLAAKHVGIMSRMHTRHHSSLHHVYFPKGIFWDKLINRLSTKIIAISKPVKTILVEWEKVDEKKVVLVPHGFLLESFQQVDESLLHHLKQKYSIGTNHPIVGVVSRWTEWKGVQFIIPAFKQLLEKYPNAILMLFNSSGDFSKEINVALEGIDKQHVRLIQFEPEMAAAYHLFDVLVHVPIDDHSEAFGQVYVEAMAAGVPMVATPSGIGVDILQHQVNSWVVDYKDELSIVSGIEALLSDNELYKHIVMNGTITAKQFSLNKMLYALIDVYESA